MVKMKYQTSDNAQQQFVYFIVVICCNTLKSFLSRFL